MSAALETGVATLEALGAEWDELAERTGASPFLRAGWVGAWWRAFGHGRLELHAVRQAGRLVALLPVLRGRDALASPSNWHTPEFGLLSESEAATEALLATLFQGRPRRVSLSFLASEASNRLRRAAEAHGYRVLQRTLQRSPFVRIDGDWEAYVRSLGKNLRGDLARRERLLGARGRVELEVSEGRDGLDGRLAEGFALEASGWKGARGTAIDSAPGSRGFYVEVARWAAERGWLRLAFLRLDGRALAFDFCLEHAGVHSMLKTGYDAAHAELSPGKLLRQRMLARAFRSGLCSYELLGDAEPWKLAWARETRARELVQGFRPSPLGRLDWTLFAHARPLARRARELARGLARARAGSAGES